MLTPEENLLENSEEQVEEEVEEVQEEVVDEGIWTCSACTFENSTATDACEICTTPRPP